MNFSPANVLAWTFALLLHALVVGAFFVDWGADTKIEVQSDRPYFIPAQMVSENPHTAKQANAAAKEAQRRAARKKEAAQRQRDQEQQAIRKQQMLDEQAEQKAKEEVDRLTRLRAEQEARRDAEAQKLADDAAAQEKLREEERQARLADELQQLVNAELDAIEAVTDSERAMAYVGQIQNDIIQNWSRPPSARNGMQAILKVFLVPTGEVVDVAILDSSGNDAFDRSAIQAVRKVRRFDVPKDAKLFEDKFREFEVLFRPEDLRL